jgi:predicted transcriptional regulator of viral defense system
MKHVDLSIFDTMPYFTTEAVKQLVDGEKLADGTTETNLYRWVKAGLIIRLKKGVYMTRRFFEQHRSNDAFSPMVSAILIPQSYLSLEYILQRYGVLTEVTFPVTSVTIKQNRVIKNTTGTYSYRNIKNDLYSEFDISEYMGISIARARPGKALFDYFYLRPLRWEGGVLSRNLLEELRLDVSDISEEDWNIFQKLVEESRSIKMERVYRNMRKTTWPH